MARNLRSLSIADIDRLPSGCGSCLFWESGARVERRCGVLCDKQARASWQKRVSEEWGDCGKVAYEDDVVLGFIKYAPSGYFPQAANFPAAPLDPAIPLISCLHIAADARHRGLGSVLLKAALRDLAMRGEKRVEAFGSVRTPTILDDSPVVGMDFLIRNGFTVSRPDSEYPLLKLDLKALLMLTENLESVFQSLRLKRLPKRVPAS